MLFGHKKLYRQTRKIKPGEAELSPLLDALKEWTNEKYGINVINVVYGKIGSGPHKERPRLNLIVETQSDYAKMYQEPFVPNESYQTAISARFVKLVKDAGLEKEYDTDHLLVIYDDFSAMEMTRTSSQLLEHHKKHLLSKFSDIAIWDIVQSEFSAEIAVFYNQDDDITENDNNGNSERIRKECFRFIKPYDEFDYCQFDTFTITFDSKQNLDENYRGNLYYYFK